MKRLFSMILALMLVVGLAGAAGLAKAAVGDGYPLQEQVLSLVAKLELTPAQKTQAALILLANQGQAQADLAQVRAAVRDMAEVIRYQGSDEAAVRAAYQVMAGAGEELMVSRARLLAELRGILTPQQVAVLDAERQNMIDQVNERLAHRQALVTDWIDHFAD